VAGVHNAGMQFRRILLLLGAIAMGAPALPASNASTKSSDGRNYMWVDKDGQRHYGDAVPPEFSQGESRVLNNQGVELQRENARRNAQQLEEDKRRQQDQQQRQQHDRFLLTTYTSIRDIERLRDERLDQIDGQIKAAALYIESLNTRLAAMQVRAQQFKPYNTSVKARRMPDDLAEDLVRASSEVRAQHKAADRRRQELLNTRAQFDVDIARYRELTSRSATNP